jgi:hypothetical protein
MSAGFIINKFPVYQFTPIPCCKLHPPANSPAPSSSTVRAKQRTVKGKAAAFGRNAGKGLLEIGFYVSHSGIMIINWSVQIQLITPGLNQLLILFSRF